jgi:hypothetical protein
MKNQNVTWLIIGISAMVLISCGTNNNLEAEKITNTKNNIPKQIKQEIIIDDNPSPISWKVVKKYNSIGKIEEELNYDKGDILSSKRVYIYNKENKIKEEQYFSPRFNELNSKTFYHYNSLGKLESHIEMNNSNKITLKSLYTYNDKGQLLSQEFSSGFTRKHEFKYYPNNVLKTKIYTNKDGTKDFENFDEKGYKNRDKNSGFKYDEKGNTTEEFHNYPDGYTKFTFEYKYNANGDWTEKKNYFSESKSQKGELRNTEKREITYYQ